MTHVLHFTIESKEIQYLGSLSQNCFMKSLVKIQHVNYNEVMGMFIFLLHFETSISLCFVLFNMCRQIILSNPYFTFQINISICKKILSHVVIFGIHPTFTYGPTRPFLVTRYIIISSFDSPSFSSHFISMKFQVKITITVQHIILTVLNTICTSPALW